MNSGIGISMTTQSREILVKKQPISGAIISQPAQVLDARSFKGGDSNISEIYGKGGGVHKDSYMIDA